MERDGSLQGMYEAAPYGSSCSNMVCPPEYLNRVRILSQTSPTDMDFNFNDPVLPQQPQVGTLLSPTGQGEAGVETNRRAEEHHDPPVIALGPLTAPHGSSTLASMDSAQIAFSNCEPANVIDPILSGNVDMAVSGPQRAAVPTDERDRTLIEHFVDNVLGFVFPIIEVHQQGPTRAQEVLFSLENNKTYFHCCLSISAIHLKTSMGLSTSLIDHDIMRHRYAAVSHLCQSFASGADHLQNLDATLAMIFFHCCVGVPNDQLLDIPWQDHLNAASNILAKLKKPPSSFSLSLITWIDILGATMLCKTPYFAHTYRDRHLKGMSLGLRKMMGCDDRVMFLIAEIACLEALRSEGKVDDVSLCHHVASLSAQLDYTEPEDPTLEIPFSPLGAIQPQKLTKTITAVFRIAARIHLRTLLPGFDCYQPSNLNLVKAVADTLQYIPSGPYGFDRSLVWPYLVTGAASVSSSPFRRVLTERVAFSGDTGDFGSFGKMFGLLQEVWRLADDPISSSAVEAIPKRSSSPSFGTPGVSIRRKHVHWREVMRRNGWRFLLM